MLKSQLWKDFQKLNIRLPVSNCQPPPSLGTPSVWPPEDLCLLSHHQPVSQRVCLLFCHPQPGHLRSPVTSTKVALLGLSSIYGFLRGPIPFADASLQPNHWRSFSSTPVGHLCGSQNIPEHLLRWAPGRPVELLNSCHGLSSHHLNSFSALVLYTSVTCFSFCVLVSVLVIWLSPLVSAVLPGFPSPPCCLLFFVMSVLEVVCFPTLRFPGVDLHLSWTFCNFVNNQH